MHQRTPRIIPSISMECSLPMMSRRFTSRRAFLFLEHTARLLLPTIDTEHANQTPSAFISAAFCFRFPLLMQHKFSHFMASLHCCRHHKPMQPTMMSIKIPSLLHL